MCAHTAEDAGIGVSLLYRSINQNTVSQIHLFHLYGICVIYIYVMILM